MAAALTATSHPSQGPGEAGGSRRWTLLRTWMPYGSAVVGVIILAVAYHVAVEPDAASLRYPLYWIGMLVGFLPTAVRLLQRGVSRGERIGLIVLLAAVTYVPRLLRDGSGPTFSDELLHWYQTNTMASDGSLFVQNPMVPAIGHYPGFDVLVVGIHMLGVPLWPAGLLVVGAAHVALLLGVGALAFELTGHGRIAATSAVLFAAGPAFSSFTVLVSYESLGLPLAVWALVLALHAVRNTARRAWLVSGSAVLIACTSVTHQLSSLMLAAWLLVFTAGAALSWLRHRHGRRIDMVVLGGLAGFAITFGVLWVVVQRWDPLPYLLPPDVSLLPGSYSVSHVPFDGSGLPLYEQVAGLLAPLVITLPVVVGLFRGRSYFTARPEWAFVLAVFYVAYPLTFLAEFNGSAGSVVHRSWPFLYVGIVVLAAVGVIRLLDEGISGRTRRIPRFPGAQTAARCKPAVLTLLLVILLVGNTANDSPDADRFPGPWVAGTSRASTPEMVAAAIWLRKTAGVGARVLTDEDEAYNFLAYASAVPVSGVPTWQLTETTAPVPQTTLALIVQKKIGYVVVDRRMATALSSRGYWYGDHDPDAFKQTEPFSVAAVSKLDTEPWASRVYVSQDFRIYRIDQTLLAEIAAG